MSMKYKLFNLTVKHSISYTPQIRKIVAGLKRYSYQIKL